MERDGLRYLQFPNLATVPHILHAIFLRFAFSANKQPTAFNLGLPCNQADQQVWANRLRVRQWAGARQMVFARQVHGSQVAVVKSTGASATQDAGGNAIYLAGDALITNVPDYALFIQVADCQPILIVDSTQHVVANIHAGWRGSIQNIIGRTVAKMQQHFGCRPEHLICGIGPSLGPCCAEFVNFRKEIPSHLWSYRLAAKHFDFWRLSRDQLIAAGVPTGNIYISQMCTRCNQHLFFSYRGERHTGRFAAVIAMH